MLVVIRDFELVRGDIVNYAWSGLGHTGVPVSFVPMHTMHMSNDGWMCQFHRDPVSMPAIFIGTRLRYVYDCNRREGSSWFYLSECFLITIIIDLQ